MEPVKAEFELLGGGELPRRRVSAPVSADLPQVRLIELQQHLLEQQAGRTFTDQELLDMRPTKDADHETWTAYHKLLSEAGKLNPPK